MKLDHYHWDKITITYDSPVPRFNKPDTTEEVIRHVSLTYLCESDDYSTLRLVWGRGNLLDRSMLLGRAKVKELTPFSAKFEAYWWTSSLDSNKENKSVRADIVCEFEEQHV